jgi:hypothetical protein
MATQAASSLTAPARVSGAVLQRLDDIGHHSNRIVRGRNPCYSDMLLSLT